VPSTRLRCDDYRRPVARGVKKKKEQNRSKKQGDERSGKKKHSQATAAGGESKGNVKGGNGKLRPKNIIVVTRPRARRIMWRYVIIGYFSP